MTTDAGSGPRRLFPRRRRNGDGAGPSPPEVAPEFTTEELQEFVAADYLPSDADPEFREALRRKLWALLEAQRGLQRSATELPRQGSRTGARGRLRD